MLRAYGPDGDRLAALDETDPAGAAASAIWIDALEPTAGERAALAARGFHRFSDRLDLAAVLPNSGAKRAILGTIRALPPLRFAGQFAISASTIAAIKAE